MWCLADQLITYANADAAVVSNGSNMGYVTGGAKGAIFDILMVTVLGKPGGGRELLRLRVQAQVAAVIKARTLLSAQVVQSAHNNSKKINRKKHPGIAPGCGSPSEHRSDFLIGSPLRFLQVLRLSVRLAGLESWRNFSQA